MPVETALELGKQLSALLDEWDVLGRWMAHYVAELITAAEAADGGVATAAARSRAAQEILLLWSHRATLPRPYPLESFDRILAALDRLEDRSASGRLGRYFGDDAPSDSELAVVPLLKVAARVDDEVGDVVACLIAEAVIEAKDAEARWLPIALEIGEEQNARALRRLMTVARRSRWVAPTQQSDSEDEPLEAPETDENTEATVIGTANTAHVAPAREPTNDGADEASADARLAALVDAIDRAIVTLSQLKVAVSKSADSSDS